MFRYKLRLLSGGGSYDNNSRLWSSYYPGADIIRATAINRSNMVFVSSVFMPHDIGTNLAGTGFFSIVDRIIGKPLAFSILGKCKSNNLTTSTAEYPVYCLM